MDKPDWQTLVRDSRLRAGLAAATLHRRGLKRVSFIGVTGSCGKTTTKELIAAALASELRGRKTPGEGNGLAVTAKTVLRTTSRDAFCVLEVAAGNPGDLARTARLVRPRIAVVTHIGSDHHTTYRTLEATAAEKRHLLEHAADGATAVLNLDDPRVTAMAAGFGGRVVTFGCSPGAMLRAEQVRSAWPKRLSFTLRFEDRLFPVQTQLCGRHWVGSVLASLGVAVAMGVSLERSIAAITTVAPTPGRMSPVARGGVTFVCDHIKAPLWTMESVFEFLAEGEAARKVAVIGTISDYAGSSSKAYRRVAERALSVADEVLFVGPNARRALRARHDPEGPPLHAFEALPAAAQHLRSILRAGDLVVLKGSLRPDKLHRLVSAYSATHGVDPRS
jgi:UDP-N-acetylmuramoyl-tripeptide--D-alanyl-D-alanine ligase